MIYDSFIFFNELDLLELRLRELESVVDRFVVVEAPVTFAGRPKPLLFGENRDLFKRWDSKIIHIIVNDMPTGPDPWQRERHQRNAIRRGLTQAKPDDGVIVSDADEIPSAQAIRQWQPRMGVHRFEQMFCYYWLNCVAGTWTGSRILPFSFLEEYSDIDAIRRLECPVLRDGGWHFSFLGRTEAIRAKLEAYSHQDLNLPTYKEHRYLSQVTSLGLDLFSREGMTFRFCEVNEKFPTPVQKNPERYSPFICQARFEEDWYPPQQLIRLASLFEKVRSFAGTVLEIGCWEGRSTVALAHACHPETLWAIDTWMGNEDEDVNHPTVLLARSRDVFGRFRVNISALTGGNVHPIRQNCHAVLQDWSAPIKFAHIDASHDYNSMRRAMEAVLRLLVPGGIICGSDFLTASADRGDLDGGVERAVRELLPGFESSFNLWWWSKLER